MSTIHGGVRGTGKKGGRCRFAREYAAINALFKAKSASARAKNAHTDTLSI